MWQSHSHYPFNSLHSSLNHRKQALPVPYLYHWPQTNITVAHYRPLTDKFIERPQTHGILSHQHFEAHSSFHFSGFSVSLPPLRPTQTNNCFEHTNQTDPRSKIRRKNLQSKNC